MKYRQWRAPSFLKTTEPNHLSPRCFSALTWVYFYLIFSFCSNLHPPCLYPGARLYIGKNIAGHATILSRQCEHVERPQSYYIYFGLKLPHLDTEA